MRVVAFTALTALVLGGCTAQRTQEPSGAARIQQEYEQASAQIERHGQEALKAIDRNLECNRQLRIGMTASQVQQVKACKHLLTSEGKLMGWNTTTTARGTFVQVRWGDGFIYFDNGVLVTIQQ